MSSVVVEEQRQQQYEARRATTGTGTMATLAFMVNIIVIIMYIACFVLGANLGVATKEWKCDKIAAEANFFRLTLFVLFIDSLLLLYASVDIVTSRIEQHHRRGRRRGEEEGEEEERGEGFSIDYTPLLKQQEY